MLKASDHPEPALQTTALRYAAGDLTPGEASAFEEQLAANQDARDALSEAVRLSAAALGQLPPTPHHSFRVAMRDRLTGWYPGWLARRAYRGHPLAWSGLGAAIMVACALVGSSLAERQPVQEQPTLRAALPIAPEPHSSAMHVATAPMPREAELPTVAISTPTPATCGESSGSSIAELWAHLSTTENVEKAHEDEMRWRLKIQNATTLYPVRSQAGDTTREP